MVRRLAAKAKDAAAGGAGPAGGVVAKEAAELVALPTCVEDAKPVKKVEPKKAVCL